MSHQYDLSPYSIERNSSQLNNIDIQRAAVTEASKVVDSGKMPDGFPIHLWQSQQDRYRHNWDWFTGKTLNEEAGKLPNGETVYKFPLKINPVRNFSRKHAALLFGEVPEHTHRPLVKCVMRPIMLEEDSSDEEEIELPTPPSPPPAPTPSPDGQPPAPHTPQPPQLPKMPATDPEKLEARFYSNIVNRVWEQSGGNAMMMENGVLSQFLGGSFFTLNHVPWRKDLPIPIVIRNPKPDFVMPIWGSDDNWELLEAYIVYRVPAKTAELEYGLTSTDGGPWVVFVEHWTRQHHSIYLDGKPLVANFTAPDGTRVKVSYDKATNKFGFVPVFYIPRLRETGFYGSDLVADIEGLTLELNGRMADTGSAMMRTAHRKWFGRNIQGNPRNKQFDNGEFYTDLGMENPAAKHPPELWPEDPPGWSETLTGFNGTIWDQLLREGNLTPVAFGEDEGSQRSALTLAIRFWPTVVIAKAQRIFWTEGLRRIAYAILRMCNTLEIEVGGKAIPNDISLRFDVEMDWLPLVPRDREQTINEVVLLSSTTPPRMSIDRSLELLGDVHDPAEEKAAILRDMLLMSAMTASQSQTQMSANTQVQTPVATDGLEQE